MKPKKFKLAAGAKHYLGRTRYEGPCVVESFDDLDARFPDRFQALDEQGHVIGQDEGGEPEPGISPLNVIHVGGGWYDVVREDGSRVNERRLRLKEAYGLAGSSNGEEEETEDEPEAAGSAKLVEGSEDVAGDDGVDHRGRPEPRRTRRS
jgi:hypothetical protein